MITTDSNNNPKDSMDKNHQEQQRIRPSRPNAIDQDARNVSYPPALSHKVGQHHLNNDPKTTTSPLYPSVAPIHFGVVGEGKAKKVLAFNSMSSRSLIVEDTTSGPWRCAACSYENSDCTFSKCSMCGTSKQAPSVIATNHNTMGAMPAVAENDSMNEGFENQPRLPKRQISRDFSSLRMVMATSSSKKRNSIDPSMLEPAVTNSGDCTTSSLAFELANMSLAGAGWACQDCTFVNTNPMHLTCAVCGQKKPKEDKKANGGYESIQDFLSSSMANVAPGSWDPQMEAFLQLEEVATEKERLALVVEEQKALMTAAEQRAGAVKVSQEELDNARESLKVLEDFYRDEKKEYDAMAELQCTKATEIERVEGERPSLSHAGRATRPGVQCVTPQTLEWIGQQRMLDDWRLQLDERAREIETIRADQSQARRRLRRSVSH